MTLLEMLPPAMRLSYDKQETFIKLATLSLAMLAAFARCVLRLSWSETTFPSMCSRLFSVLRFESVIHEFDPYFNYRTTR